MSNEISPDVDYLIEIWKRIDRKAIEMKIIYETIEIDRQNDFDLTLTKDKPEIKLVEQSNKWKTLLMIDPDAPSSVEPTTGPFLHWILANFLRCDGEDGDEICPYRCPGPRSASGIHRYIFLLFESDEPIREEKKFLTIEDRRKYPLREFIRSNRLTLICQTYFQLFA